MASFSVQRSKVTSFFKVVFFVLQNFFKNFYVFKVEGSGVWCSCNNNGAFLGYPVKEAY